MRSATISSLALLDNLDALLSHHGSDAALDLRGNAYGLGAREVSHFATTVGFQRAHWGDRDPGETALSPAPEDFAVDGWWSGPAGDIVEFSAEVISVKRVPAGAPVSYGYHYTTTAETTLALVAAGYADGVPRTASTEARVEINGRLHPIAGRIAMDQFVVDAGNEPVVVGDRAHVWGQHTGLENWSAWSGRPTGALLSHLGSRVVKTWL